MPRILLVEDSPTYALSVIHALSQCGHIVEVETEGDKGLERAIQGNYDLLILDVNLPGMSGPDICHEYRAKGFTTPIIVCTTEDQLGSSIKGLTTGTYYFILKDKVGAESLAARAETIFLRQQRRRAVS